MLDQVDFNFSLDAEDVADDDEDVDDGEDDGLAAQDAMSELFVAADRLMHDPDDHEGVLRLTDAAGVVEAMALPYGFAPGVWNEIVERVRRAAHPARGRRQRRRRRRRGRQGAQDPPPPVRLNPC